MEKEKEKRKRKDDGGSNDRKAKPREEDGGVKGAVPADEEVEEFFAILKRIQVAVKYFQERNAGPEISAAAPRWSPKFEREDFDGVKTAERNQSVGLDLNSDPGCDVLDCAD